MQKNMKHKTNTAKNAGLMACRFCHCVSNTPVSYNTKNHMLCPSCGAKIRPRKENSIERTWAFLISAVAFYLPANILPVMSSVYLGQGQTNTIMSGVIELAAEGFWILAIIVFIASIIIPILKIIVLGFLLVSIHYRSEWRPKDRTRAYKLTEFVGRWSMVDIYVIAILVSLVQFGPLASVQAGIGSLCFAAVIILTMFAAESFDPRLIWDAMEPIDD